MDIAQFILRAEAMRRERNDVLWWCKGKRLWVAAINAFGMLFVVMYVAAFVPPPGESASPPLSEQAAFYLFALALNWSNMVSRLVDNAPADMGFTNSPLNLIMFPAFGIIYATSISHGRSGRSDLVYLAIMVMCVAFATFGSAIARAFADYIVVRGTKPR